METAVKKGVTDPWDAELYQHALQLFAQKIQAYSDRNTYHWSFLDGNG